MTFIPPAIYDHPPNMPVIEYVAKKEEIDKYCVQIGMPVAPAGYWWDGCSVVRWGICYVYRIDNDLVRRHELAHCNGWRHEDEVKAVTGQK